MFRDITSDDNAVTPITVHKRFLAQKYDTVDNTSYLGVMSMQGTKATDAQMHSFATYNIKDQIETPPEMKISGKIKSGNVSKLLSKLQEERSRDFNSHQEI